MNSFTCVVVLRVDCCLCCLFYYYLLIKTDELSAVCFLNEIKPGNLFVILVLLGQLCCNLMWIALIAGCFEAAYYAQ